MILPGETGHSHYMAMMSCEAEPDGMHLIGVTSCRAEYVPNDNGMDNGSGTYIEHCHTFDLGGAGHSELSGVVDDQEAASMNTKDRIKAFRDAAQAVATSNPTEGKRLTAIADEMEKEVAVEGVEETIAARVKNGDLFPKAVHETALAGARTEGEAKVRKELEDAKKAEEAKATTIASRIDALKKAKIDPKFALTANRTVEQTVAAIPVGTEGDKMFAERMEEWTNLQKTTGQMTATEAAATEGGTRPAVASTNNSGAAAGSSKKSALSFA